MGVEPRKVAAITAAVEQYLEEERALRREQEHPPVLPSVWALAGRERIMANRELLCLKLWK